MTRTRMSPSLRRVGVLVHYPAILAAVVGSAAILALSAAGGPLFRSSAGSAVVREGIRGQGGLALAVSASGVLSSDIVSYRERALDAETARVPSLGPETTSLIGSTARVLPPTPDVRAVKVRPLARTGFGAHIEVVARASQVENGVWLPDVAARVLHVEPGDRITLAMGPFTVDARIAGVYGALVGRVPTYWAPVARAIYAADPKAPPPPPPLLMDEGEFLHVTTALQDSGEMQWSFDLTPTARSTLDLNSADSITTALRHIASRSHDLTTPLGVALQQPAVSSPLDGLVRRARTAENSIAGPVGTLSLTGILVALVGVLAAAVYGVRRRRTEVRILNAIGISWTRLGTRFAAEAFVPLAAGAALGWLLAGAAVGALGPSSVIGPAARSDSLEGVAAGFVVALLVFAVVAAIAGRVETDMASSARMRSAVSGALWEIPVLILAGAALYEIGVRGTAPIEGTNGTVHIDRLFLLFPLLFIAGLGGLAVRVVSRLLSGSRRRSAGWPVSLYLAFRRLASAPRVALLLVTASTLAVGIPAYAGTVVATVRSAAFDKTMVAVGSDVAASHGAGLILPPAGRPAALTSVVTIPGSLSEGAEEGRRTNVIAIDPSTFAGAAFWDRSFSSSSLQDLLAELSRPQGSTVPMLVVNGRASPGATVTIAGYPIPVDVVDTPSAFPGEHAGVNLVVSAPALQQTLGSHGVTFDSVGAAYQTWARGNPAQATAYFKSLGISPQLIASASERLHAPDLRALSWAFGFMEVLGAVTALVALIGLVLYLQARQRGREMSFALSSRMGLSSGAHLVAVGTELLFILLTALVLGAALATAAAALVYRQLDPLPSLPPSALLRFPFALIAEISGVIALSTLAGAWIVHVRTQHANIAKVMRFAD
ncbi:MAG: hypothetical protein ACJ76P_04165 [Actinomycetota bacterium]